jgi:hypothetical protein
MLTFASKDMYGPIVHKSGQNVGESYIMYGMYEVLIFPVICSERSLRRDIDPFCQAESEPLVKCMLFN